MKVLYCVVTQAALKTIEDDDSIKEIIYCGTFKCISKANSLLLPPSKAVMIRFKSIPALRFVVDRNKCF